MILNIVINKKSLFLAFISFLFIGTIQSQENWQHYAPTIKKHIYADYKGMFKEAGESLKYPFITPGSAQYSDVLWDWDSWLTNIALQQIFQDKASNEARQEAQKYEQGSVLNYLEYGGMNGWIPFRIPRNAANRIQWMDQIIEREGGLFETNMHKPCLAQHAAFLIKQNDGDAEWLREKFYFLQAFVGAYQNHFKDRVTGLHFWADGVGVGVDNDPSTYYRPKRSSGNIFLNSLMYRELLAMEYIAKKLELSEIAEIYQREADELRDAVRKHCWDERDGFYYSVDLNLEPYEAPVNWWERHIGGPRDWDCLIQRIDIWSGFMSMWAGIATPAQAERMVNEHVNDSTRFNSPYGIRTLSPLEKMYDPRASGNPSSWLGPIWGISNYMVFSGLLQYGYEEEAREIAEETIVLFGRDIEKSGALHEYYLPDSGQPVLNKGFQNWNYLVVNMIAWLEGSNVIKEF